MPTQQPHERLAEAMNARRLSLHLNWKAVASRAGISYESLRAIRRGEYRPSELSAAGLDEALEWEPGSVDAILDGGDPTPADAPASGDDLERRLREAQELLARAQELLDQVGDRRQDRGGRAS